MNFKEHTNALRLDINEYLENVFKDSSAPSELIEAMQYSLFSNGKRLRPIIALHVARELGVDEKAALPICAAIEMIHTYSLIHDDLPAMDNDDLRRGKPTSHVKFGEDMAILAGDGLLNFAFELMLKECPENNVIRYINAVKYISKCSGAEGMIGGQVLDIKNNATDIDDLKKMHGLKTGKLFSASVMSMVYLADLSKEIEDSYFAFSKKFGLLFQITDDILDVKGQVESLGKTIGKDEKLGKVTYVTKYGLKETENIANNTLVECLNQLKQTGKKHDYLCALSEYIRKRDK